MALYFLDSSAIAKRYLLERGSTWVQSICAEEAIAVSALASVELSSTLARHVRESRITAGHQEAVFDEFLRDSERCLVIDLDPSVISAASRMYRTIEGNIPLRSLDAIQLACAMSAFERIRRVGLSPGAFVSADRRLLAAAAWAGLPVENPDDHP